MKSALISRITVILRRHIHYTIIFLVICFNSNSFSCLSHGENGFTEQAASSYNPRDNSTVRNNYGQIFFLIFMVVLGAYVITMVNLNQNASNWQEKFFPNKLGPRSETFLRLGAMMIRYDKEESGKKIAYLYRYFKEHFPEPEIEFHEILKEAYQHPVKLEAAAAWINKYKWQKSMRVQLIYFLAGIAVVDGEMNSTEKSIITKLSELLYLTKKELDSIMSMYAEFEPKQKTSQNRYYKSSSKRALEECSKILGVSAEAGMDEIKKAYRQLVKLHHPDRFSTESIEQQELATERFLKLQKAYEYLEKSKFG
ncbi:MAG: DnaJ like chaperone protein [Crocinitomicaceae bacterium]|jgi:DnaJ like chaperone protein